MKEEHGMDSSRMNLEIDKEEVKRILLVGFEDGTKEFPAENAACRSYDTCNGVRSDAAV